MTLLIVIVLAAILMVIGIMVIKKTAREKISGPTSKTTAVTSEGPTPPTPNPGSIPDKAGTRGDGGSALSSGGQG